MKNTNFELIEDYPKKGQQHLRRIWLVIVFAACVSLLATLLSVDLMTVVPTDFVNLFVGSQLVKEGRGDFLYNIEANFSSQRKILGISNFYNITIIRTPLFVPAFLTTLTFFTIVNAFKVFAILNFVLLILFFYFSIRISKKLKKFKEVIFLLTLFFFPTLTSIASGQLSLVLSLVLLIVYITLKGKKESLAGVASSFLATKIQFLVFIHFLLTLSSSKKRYLYGFILSCVLLFLLSVSASRLNWVREYPSFILATENSAFGSRVSGMWSFTGFLFASFDFFREKYQYAIVLNVILYLLTLILFLLRYKNLSFDKKNL